MILKKSFSKRRRHERYKVNGCKIGVSKLHYTKIGYIYDICLGGLAFQYVDSGEGKNEFPKSSILSIFLDNKGFYMGNIPFTTIADFKIKPTFMEMRQRSVQFDKIPKDQNLHLQYLISDLTSEKITDKRSGQERRSGIQNSITLLHKLKNQIFERRKVLERRACID